MKEDKSPVDEEISENENAPDKEGADSADESGSKKQDDGVKKEAVDEKAKRKVVFSLCYIWGVLFFLPLLMYGADKDARRHANEGLIILIIALVGNILFGIFMHVNSGGVFGMVFGILLGLLNLGIFVLAVIGIVYVVKEREEPIPLIGGITIIK